MGGSLVSLLRVQAADQAPEPKVQGKAPGEGRGRLEGSRGNSIKNIGYAPGLLGQSFCEESVEAGGRSFLIRLLRFDNGSFVAVSEGGARLGSLAVALDAGPSPVATTVIPAKFGAFFLRLAAQRISSATRGISIVSAGVQNELGTDVMKALMEGIMKMVRDE
ncbi:hypothetical protein CENSYa_1736 [Cenarchaeum symbiosum A]|uniref:Uncharacterized protein n=1 Tax=Cenarchaeum symbiosum (strain A) TaxID=414004 RepID=A0RYD0_CENSY|nr:hypothetical protein CENSYa_1736 [Cenarchaeum symbiosum A]